MLLQWLVCLAVMALGLIIGLLSYRLVLWLPEKMQADWLREAQALLSGGDDDTAPMGNKPAACGLLESASPGRPSGNSRQAMLVVLLSMFLCSLPVYYFQLSMQALFLMVFSISLLVLAVIDHNVQLLPDVLTLPLLWLGLLLNVGAMFVPLEEAVLGAALGYGFLWSVYWLFKLITGKAGLGYGDFKLLAALGAWLGWQAIPFILFIAAALGLLLVLLLMVLGRQRRQTEISFGPYLAVAGWLWMYWQTPLLASLPF